MSQYDEALLKQILRADPAKELTHTTVCNALIRLWPEFDQMTKQFIQETVEEAYYLLKQEGFDPTEGDAL